MKHEGALSIHANGELLLELGVDGTVTAGPAFLQDDNVKLVFRALALKYPRWAGDMIANYVRSLPALVSSRVAVATAAGGPVAGDLATRIYKAVLEEVAIRAEENGQEAEVREAERQKVQFREEQAAKVVHSVELGTVLQQPANGSLEPDAAPGS